MKIHFLSFFFFAFGFPGLSLIAKENASSIEGEWFSNVMRQPKGFYARELYFYRSFNSGKFVFSQISFNETRKWEEVRYSGKWSLENRSTDTISLKSEDCSIYASSELGKRWALIRTFDCDHLAFRAKILSDKEITLSPSMDFENSENFFRIQNDRDSIQSVVILTDSKNFTSWGLRLNKTRKDSNQYIVKRIHQEKIPVKIQEAVDSSAIYKPDRRVEIGDILVIKNGKAKSLLD